MPFVCKTQSELFPVFQNMGMSINLFFLFYRLLYDRGVLYKCLQNVFEIETPMYDQVTILLVIALHIAHPEHFVNL
jgi:hypothetical protein